MDEARKCLEESLEMFGNGGAQVDALRSFASLRMTGRVGGEVLSSRTERSAVKDLGCIRGSTRGCTRDFSDGVLNNTSSSLRSSE